MARLDSTGYDLPVEPPKRTRVGGTDARTTPRLVSSFGAKAQRHRPTTPAAPNRSEIWQGLVGHRCNVVGSVLHHEEAAEAADQNS